MTEQMNMVGDGQGFVDIVRNDQLGYPQVVIE